MFRFRNFIVVLCLSVAFVAVGARAQDLPIAAFFGSFKGGGVAENRDSIYFGVTVRDLDVTIRPEGSGFRVDWTTISVRAVTRINLG